MSAGQPPRGRLAWHSLLNAAGQGIPVLVALVAVPALVRGLGAERFGLLTLGWAVVGYFSFLDLGLGRALTQLVAERSARGEREGLGATVRAALGVMLLLGLAGGAAGALAAAPFVERWVAVSPALRGEALRAFLFVAAAVPVVVLTTGLRGVLEAHHRFDLVNAIRAPLGVLTYAAPVALLAWTRSLAAVTALLLATRLVGLVAHLACCRRVMPELLERRARGAAFPLRALLASGGWITVSGVLSPIMTTLDRFVVGAVASAAAVAFYTAPYEMATKLLIVPGAIFSSVFPAFAAAAAARRADDAELPALFARAAGLTLAAVFPATLALVLFAPEVLGIWMGPEFAARSAGVLQVLAVGVLCNALAHVPIALVQAAGRAELSARLHLLEVPPYLLALWLLVHARGVEGAALAWGLRAAVDAAALFVLARRVAPSLRAPGHGWLWALAAAGPLAAALAPLAVRLPLAWRAALAVGLGGALLQLVWARVAPSGTLRLAWARLRRRA